MQDTEKIIGYILKERKNTEKTFYEFFLPGPNGLSGLNPNEELNREKLEQNENWEGTRFAQDKLKIYGHGYGQKKRRLYLR